MTVKVIIILKCRIRNVLIIIIKLECHHYTDTYRSDSYKERFNSSLKLFYENQLQQLNKKTAWVLFNVCKHVSAYAFFSQVMLPDLGEQYGPWAFSCRFAPPFEQTVLFDLSKTVPLHQTYLILNNHENLLSKILDFDVLFIFSLGSEMHKNTSAIGLCIQTTELFRMCINALHKVDSM